MADSTHKSDPIIPAEVRDLIRESQKIQGWIERLADHASDVRTEVFDKVRSDYERRLSGVNGQLAEHRAQLVDTLEVRRSEVAGLRRDRDEHAAELEEVELRHAVGEYEDKEFETRRSSIQESLDELDRLLEDEDRTVAELSEIIASILSAGPGAPVALAAVSSEAVGESADGSEDETDGGVEQEAAVAPSTPATSAATMPAPAGERPAPAPAKKDTRAEAAAEGEDLEVEEAEGDYLDELEFLESLSLSESERFDAVSAMLDEEEGDKGGD